MKQRPRILLSRQGELILALGVAIGLLVIGCGRTEKVTEDTRARGERLAPKLREAAEAYTKASRERGEQAPTILTVRQLRQAGYLKGVDVSGLEDAQVLLPSDTQLPAEEFRLRSSDIEQAFVGVDASNTVATPKEDGTVVWVKLTRERADNLRQTTALVIGRQLRLIAADVTIMEGLVASEIPGPWFTVVCNSNDEAKAIVSRLKKME